MARTIQNPNDQNLSTPREAKPAVAVPMVPPADSQVKAKKTYAPRRSFDAAYKQRILLAYNNCENASERGALLRGEGLYYARIAAWKQELASGKLGGKHKQTKQRTDHLVREIEQLKKRLAQAEAIIDIQKKVSALLGTHILPYESSEVNS